MKLSKFKIIILLSFLVLLFSCKKEKKEIVQTPLASEPKTIVTKNISTDNSINYDDYFKSLFTLDYSESSFDNSKKDTDKKVSNKKSVVSKNISSSVVPGVRDLSKYKTKYTTKRKEPVLNITENKNNNENLDSELEGDFYIKSWGPEKFIPSSVDNPSFYVIFSKPVKSLSALSNPEKKSNVMSITPPLKGVFRWYGTNHLSFEASEKPDPFTNYTISINKKTKAIDGDTLIGDTVFRTTSEKVNIVKLLGGYVKNSEVAYSKISGAAPEYANRFYLKLNYSLTEKQVQKKIEVYCNNISANYSVEPVYDENIFSNYGATKYDKPEQKSNSFIITIRNHIPFNTSIKVFSKDSNQTFSYYSTKPFTITKVPTTTSGSKGNKTHPFRISFSQPIDKSTVARNVSFSFDFELTEDYFEVQGSDLLIYNLPIENNSTHTVTISPNLKDIYGQSLTASSYSFKINVPNPTGYVRYLDSGFKILEAQYDPKFIIEYSNIHQDGNYSIGKISNPLTANSNKSLLNNFTITQKKDSNRYFEEIDLKPYLNENGYGFVQIDASLQTNYYSPWRKENILQDNDNTITIQVTDIGVSARMGINKAVFMVRSLSTGKPLKNAEVYIYNNKIEISKNLLNDVSEYIAKGTTDENGTATIEFTTEQMNNLFTTSRYSVPYIFVKHKTDKMLFPLSGHNTWRAGIYNTSEKDPRKPKQRTFMFVDRGLYKPGETVTFKGIDRDQILGQIIPHISDYEIQVEGAWWDSEQIIEPITGTTSKSGSFDGSFKLPDDLGPGNYRILFLRNKDRNLVSNIRFTVANFERLKIQGEAIIPEITYYGGDSISSEISASYLAGGALSSANYEAAWFKEKIDYNPKSPITQNYSFGPAYGYYESRKLYSEEKGVLSSNGTANVVCASEKITDGYPYSYKIEASITDISNQKISVENNIIVHPAKFYIGVKKPSAAFAKKNDPVDFSYILVNPNGEYISSTDLVSNLKYTLTCEEWSVINEQSVNNSLYTRYQKNDVLVSSGNVKIEKEGKLNICPTKTGLHKLTISGTDSFGNYAETSYNFYVTGSDSYYGNYNNNESIELIPNKNLYNPGETAQILMQSPLPAGDYLITVEREGIFTEEVRHLETPTDVLDIKIANNYVPIVYVAVSSYSVRKNNPTHEYGEPDLEKPKGYFGITALNIDTKTKAFDVIVTSDKKAYKPGETATITLKATQGNKPVAGAELTVMAVDRGVLDLINYHVPNPIDFFYDRHNFKLYVKGGDSRVNLMDPVTYSIKDLQGGDSSEEEKEDERKDFRPTAIFKPTLITNKDGEVSCTFVVPDNLTTYRITAFGVKESLFALQEEEITVQNPINVQQVQPRRLRLRDTAECGVLITNLTPNAQVVNVTLNAQSPTKNTTEDDLAGRKTIPGEAFVDGDSEHKITVEPYDSTVVYFDVAAVKSGTVELVYTIKSDLLNEKLISPIKIEESYVYETVTMAGATTEQNKAVSKEQIAIPSFAENGEGHIKFTIDATRLSGLNSAINYVFNYPYGCLEQRTSGILPLLLFEEYITIFDLENNISNTKECIKEYFSYMKKYQHYTGGFGYWPDSNYDDLWVSTKIAYAIYLAQQKGYTKEEIAINVDSLLEFIQNKITNESEITDLENYSNYVLSLFGKGNLSITNKVYLKNGDYSISSLVYAAMTYLNDKSDDSQNKAKELAKYIESYIQPAQRSVTIKPTSSKHRSYFFGGELSELALCLKMYSQITPNDSLVDSILYTLLQRKSARGYWSNTNVTAQMLDGVKTYIKARNLETVDFNTNVKLNNIDILSAQLKGLDSQPVSKTFVFTSEEIKNLPRDKNIPIEIQKTGTGRAYYTTEMKYAIPDEMQTNRDEGIKIEYELYDYETGKIIQFTEGSSLVELISGKTYKVKVKITTLRDRSYLALRSPIPSGAEILDSTFVTSGSDAEISSSKRHWLSNKSILDNEVQFFWDYFYSGKDEISYTFRATRRGVYPTPPVQAECMYEPEIFGRSDGLLFVIK